MPLSTSSPAASASAVFGSAPTPATTTSDRIVSPSVSTIRTPSPSGSMRAMPVPHRSCTPAASCRVAIVPASSDGTTRPMMLGAISTTVTWHPRSTALEATSSPMKPPPTMPTRVPGRKTSRSRSASAKVRSVSASSPPATVSGRERAPVVRSRRS